jgi:hypothetical protein
VIVIESKTIAAKYQQAFDESFAFLSTQLNQKLQNSRHRSVQERISIP